MNTFQLTLKDADEIAQFYLDTTGMIPGYMQLSRGVADHCLQVVELNGVTIIWVQAHGKARWRDQMAGGGLHFGFAIESEGSLTVYGRDINADEAQIWVPGKEMDIITRGKNLTLELAVDEKLLDELGWQWGNEPLKKVSARQLSRLLVVCRHVTTQMQALQSNLIAVTDNQVNTQRDRILDELELVLQPWLTEQELLNFKKTTISPHFRLLKRAESFFDQLGIDADFEVDQLAASLNVPRRTVFYSFRKMLGIGPRRYFELKRLNELRSRLRRATVEDNTVASIATELGFHDQGRMATTYRTHFGENPSETLKRITR